VCGGCALQHLGASSYQAVKLGALRAARVCRRRRAVAGCAAGTTAGARRARASGSSASSARIGFRERFRHELIDITECLILEAPLFVVVTRLRQVAADLLPPGGSAEATLTHTDSGVDLLIEAVGPPGLGALEALAAFAEDCDLARIVWRSSGEDIPVLERRPVRVLLSGVAVPVPPGAFLQASRAAETILVDEVLSGIGTFRPALDLFAGLGTFTFALAQAGPVHAVEGEERAAAALARAALGRPGITVERRDLFRDRCRRNGPPAMPPRCSTHRAPAPPGWPRHSPPPRSTRSLPSHATPRPSRATPPN
jgi:23S rRNA (uracil1939-C5)-methyltransferase